LPACPSHLLLQKKSEEAKANLKEAVELYIESFGTDNLPESKGEIIIYPLEIVLNASMRGSRGETSFSS